jgi:succinate dehydrogenase flavin-adding protein (antitoxin of CptAB toxin-antitoxin module)
VQALCWRLLRQNDQDVWYNWATNHSQMSPPDEVPEDMLQEVREGGCGLLQGIKPILVLP